MKSKHSIQSPIHLSSLPSKPNISKNLIPTSPSINNKPSHISPSNLSNTPSNKSLLPKLSTNPSPQDENLFDFLSSPSKKTPFKEYSTRINSSLARYHGLDREQVFKYTEDDELPQLITSKPPYIPQHEKEKVRQIYSINKLNKRYKPNLTNESHIRVSINEPVQLYRNPFDSLHALRMNHQVYDEINKSIFQRQQQCFDESLSALESMTMKFKVKMPKIRVSPLLSRNFYEKREDDVDDDDKNKHYKNKSESNNNHNIIKLNQKKVDYSKMLAYHKYPNRNFPEGREQFSISLYENDLLLYGGMSSTIKSTVIWSLNLETLEWNRIPTKTVVPFLRYGHTSICIKNKLYVFGGRTKFTDITEYSQYEYFNLETKQWNITTFTSNGKRPPALRRNHIGELIGQQYLIHGGISEFNDEIVNDIHILNINNFKWSTLQLNLNTSSPYLYGHACSLVIPFELRYHIRLSVYNFPEEKKANDIKEKGLYVFGGVTQNGKLSDVMYNLTLGKSHPEWKVIDTNGKKPLARYFHSMNYYEKGNFLIVHGGRNDYKSDSFALGDTFILNLFTYEWIEVNLYSTMEDFKVLNRCGHCAIIYSSKLVIFGGMNANNYLGSSLFVVCLDSDYKNKIKNSDEVLRKRMLNNYAIVKLDRQNMKKYQYLMKHNQLEIMPEYSLPKIE